MSTILRAGLAVALAAGAVVAVGAASAGSAGATTSTARYICHVDSVIYKTPKQGEVVYIPSTLHAGPYQRGGTQSVSFSDGDLHSTTTGSSDTVGGGGGVNFEIFKADASYNHTWNRSTSVSTSHTKTYTTTSPSLPRDKRTRWTLYHKGYRFPVKQIVTYTNNCPNRSSWHTMWAPTRSWHSSQWSWEIQYAAHPHRLHT